MKIAVLLSRHRRLLALCGLSACAHLLVLELVAGRRTVPPSAPPAGESLRLRLTEAAPVRFATPARPGPPTPAKPAAPPPAAPRVPHDTQTAPARAGSVRSAPSQPPSSPEPAPTLPDAPDAVGAPLVQMPGRYRVRLPEPVRLSYTRTTQAPGAMPVQAGGATLDWRSDGERYVLSVDGVLGRLHSEGGSGDAGILPRLGTEERDGAALATEFDADGRRIVFRASGASMPDAIGAQDRASVLMQLAAIGLGEPDQIRGQIGEEIRIVVAGTDDAEIARYQVVGQEDLTTGLGRMSAWRLAKVTSPGRDRVELWLAPDRGWLPVQVRLTRPDGSVATQTLAATETGAPR